MDIKNVRPMKDERPAPALPDGSAHCPYCTMPLAGSGGRCAKHRPAPSSPDVAALLEEAADALAACRSALYSCGLADGDMGEIRQLAGTGIKIADKTRKKLIAHLRAAAALRARGKREEGV